MGVPAAQAAAGQGTLCQSLSGSPLGTTAGRQLRQRHIPIIKIQKQASFTSRIAPCALRPLPGRRDSSSLGATWHVRGKAPGPMATLRSGAQVAKTATVDISESLGPGIGAADAVVIRATENVGQKAAEAAAPGPSPEVQPDKLHQLGAAIAAGTRGRDGSVVRSPVASVGLIALGVLLVGAGVVAKMRNQQENTVDALARRGFISSDRSVPLELIQGYEDPTRVRDYKTGNAKLVELEPLAPLSEEKMRSHREQRRREHGWKKPEHVLVEGEPVPEGVDPRSVRFIPKKHPFALNKAEGEEEWSEEVARRRLRQRQGRPEKEQQRSREQLDRLRREMQLRDSAAGESGRGTAPGADDTKGERVRPDAEG